MDVSVIIPIYNTEKYIEKCIKSILQQDTKYTYEVICVNDGSTDNSDKIIEKYKNNIKYFYIENSGPGAARNFAINKAQGKYLTFIDSDDYVSFNFIQKMVEEAENNEADAVICNFYRFKDDSNILEPVDKGKKNIYYKNNIQEVLLMEFHSCNKLFRREIMLKNLYPENMFFEDVVAISSALIDCNKIVKIEDYLYYYRRTENSTTNNITNRYMDIKKAIDLIEGKFMQNGYEEEIEYLYINCILVDLAIKVMKSKKCIQDYKDIIKPVIDKYPNWYKSKLLKKEKITKKMYLWCLKHKLYFLIKLVFGRN